MSWEISSEKSVYLQLIDIIKHKILSGEYPPGSKIPSVRDLALEASVNPNTMQRAMLELERERLVNTQRTNGRFITEDINMISNIRKSLAESETVQYIQKLKSLGINKEEIIEMIKESINKNSSQSEK